jgi:hypothetical protein
VTEYHYSEFYFNGFDAYWDGEETNPYAPGTAAFRDWENGYLDAWDNDFNPDYL